MFLRVLAVLTVCGATPTMGYAECMLGNSGAERVTSIYFTNGMMATLGDAGNGRERLEREYGRRLAQGQPSSQYEFGISYNSTTQNLADDVRRAVLQKAAQEQWLLSSHNIKSWARGLARQIAAGETLDRMLEAAKKYFPNLELTQDDLTGVANAALEHFALLTEVDPATVDTHVECYLRNLGEGKRVVVVAHSQGNLYANDAIDAVAETTPEGGASIAVVGVATPAARIAGDRSGHVTAKDDVVINALRAIPGATVLKGNVDNDPGVAGDRRDFWNHAFGRSYFDAGLASRAMIDALMNVLATELPFPNEERPRSRTPAAQ